jgi:hypothetical protein
MGSPASPPDCSSLINREPMQEPLVYDPAGDKPAVSLGLRAPLLAAALQQRRALLVFGPLSSGR